MRDIKRLLILQLMEDGTRQGLYCVYILSKSADNELECSDRIIEKYKAEIRYA